MNPLRIVLARLRGFLRRDAIADDIREELAAHVEDRVRQYEAEGLPRAAAERKARARIGNLAVHLDRGYDVRGGGALEAVTRDLRWAWRSVRTRGWRAAVVAALLGITIAANAIVFSAADTFVFRTIPYAEPGDLAVIQSTSRSGPSDYLSRDALLAWRGFTDLFAGVEGHDSGVAAYLTIGGITEATPVQQITPGMFALLGVMPEWGRPFTDADAERGAPPVVVVSNSLAKRLFGSGRDAIGRSFATGHYDGAGAIEPTIVGVMPASFRFPTAAQEIWEPLDLARWRDDTGIRHVARLARGHDLTAAAALVQQRLNRIPQRLPGRAPDPVELRSLADFRQNLDARGVFALLIGAAACLLLIACANVVSLELAGAVRRLRDSAIRSTLGASRASQIRVVLFEAAIVLGISVAVALLITFWGSGVLAEQLTPAMRASLANPIDVDGRVVLFMVLVATATWMLIAVPAVLRSTRASVVSNLRFDPRVMPVSSASARIRQWLMTAQVALTVLLLAGALLFVRTYVDKVGRDTGFDARRIATLEVYYTPDVLGRHVDLNETLINRLRASPGVISLARTTGLPPSTQSGIQGPLHIDRSTEPVGRAFISAVTVDPEYFPTMGIELVSGAFFDAASPVNAVVIDETFARRHWPAGQAVGSRFDIGGGAASISRITEFRVIGVSRPLRSDRAATATGDDVFVMYMRIPPQYPVVSRFVMRVDDEDRIEALAALARAVTERAIVRVDTIEARYARLEGGTRLAATIMSGFGMMALLIATCGIFAVMAFLVAGRAREIGIRMALGADPADVRQMVFSSSLRFVVAGATIGLGAAVAASRFAESLISGVAPAGPAIYVAVTAVVLATAMTATWWPARRAARIDPAITLRAE
jgi:predicted permease